MKYWKKKAQDLKTRPTDFFKTFRPFLNTKENAENAQIKLNGNETLVRDQKEVAQVVVNHFATIAAGIGGTGAHVTSMDDFENHHNIQRIRQERKNFTTICNVTSVRQGQLKTVLESLDTNKATGCDGIPAKIMKIGAEELSQPLANLFNLCIRRRVRPSDWKRDDWMTSVTPITVLPCVDKVFARKCQLPFKVVFMNNSLPIEKHTAVKRP